jgi:hypothetical protein
MYLLDEYRRKSGKTQEPVRQVTGFHPCRSTALPYTFAENKF